MFASTYQRLSDTWALCGSGAGKNLEGWRERARKSRVFSSLSKSATWGPTNSDDSEDAIQEEKKSEAGRWNEPKKTTSEAFSTPGAPSDLKRSRGTNSTKSSDSSPKESPPPTDTPPTLSDWTTWPYCHQDTTVDSKVKPKKSLMDYMDDVCSPFHPRNLAQTTFNTKSEPALGISRMEPPNTSKDCPSSSAQNSSNIQANSSMEPDTSITTETPVDRRRQRHLRRQQRSSSVSIARTPSPHEDFEITSTQVFAVPPKQAAHQRSDNSVGETKKMKAAPLDTFTLNKETAVELERSISELTMRSSYGVATAKLSENRRMAYYAVGKHHRQSGRGGNRRCYFTGKLILCGSPFYAGSVQQGLRTLVVFCLPSSLGLPKGSEATRDAGSVLASIDGGSVGVSRMPSPSRGARSILSSRRNSKVASSSKMNYMDEMSLSVGEELDPNWGLEKEYLIQNLPEPNQELMDEMAFRYPEQFETLPVQVRNPRCWRLYVKFCFFSGLPIAEGELHYKVRDEVADNFGEEVILSHEVMEAVNGHDSAEILRLPNLKTFRYLRKHYNQQSAKLPEEVFQRKAWEMVRPEV